MAERRRNKKKKEDYLKDIGEKPSKDEYAVARYLKQKLPEKKTTLLGHKVEYFIACKAVDLLVESSWAKDKKKGELNFSNRDIAIDFMARLLEHKFFHRAKKIVVQKEVKKKKTEESKEKEEKEKEEKTKEKDAKKSPKEKTEGTDDKEGKKEGGEVVTEKKKEKKKIKLDMHLEQMFIDSYEPYVWIYDPIPLKTWITGTLMVVAAVLLCLFPLWPQTIRHYIYYLSVAAAFFLVFIIGLAVLRLVVFVLLWVFTMGRHHLWLFPNLTEDVGFFESFWPLYKYDYKGPQKEKESEEKEKEEEKEEIKSDPTPSEEKENEEKEKEEKEKEENNSSEGEKNEENGFEFIEAEEEEESPKDK